MEKSIEEMVESDQVEQPVVSFLVHENDMNHKDAENERLHETQKRNHLITCLSFIVLIIIFVTAYTVRTRIWNETITRMNETLLEMAKMHHCTGVGYAEETHTP